MTRKKWLIGVGALVGIALVATAAFVVFKQVTTAPVSQGERTQVTSAADEDSGEGGFGLGLQGDILDNPRVPGISLETARAKAAKGILIPSSEVLGKPVKICLTEEGAPQELVGIGILYESGVKFFATPSGDKNMTFEDRLPKDSEQVAVTFTDGRKKAFEVVEAEGRKYLVGKGGTQRFGKMTHKVPPGVGFIVEGTEYRIYAESGDLKENDLLKIAKEMR